MSTALAGLSYILLPRRLTIPLGRQRSAVVPLTISNATTYQITGTQFNGVTQGTTYGDEFQNATNYPLVRITNNATGRVVYAKTHDHSTMGVATGAATVFTNFDVPLNIDAGASQYK